MGDHGRMWLVIARHGHAGRRDRWRGDDSLRPLDARGARQAVNLAEVLEPLKPVRLISSPFLRCTQTLEPLVGALGGRIELADAFVPEADPSETLAFVRDLTAANAPSGTVVCTHGEVLAALLTRLASQDRTKLVRRAPGSKGCAWILEFEEAKLSSSRYIPPGR
jgi:8-oxo-(d)GTP phosphatase